MNVMSIFSNLINKRNLPATSKFATLDFKTVLFVIIILYAVLCVDCVKSILKFNITSKLDDQNLLERYFQY